MEEAGCKGCARCRLDRVRAWAAVALSLAGCGRIGFDAPGDTSNPEGHDEDGDGFADVADNCPQIANADQLDDDLDRVGNACDPEPGAARQRIAYFNSLGPGDEALSIGGEGTWTRGAEGWMFDGGGAAGGNGQLTKEIAIGNADIWATYSITGRRAVAQGYQLAIALVDVTADNPYYYGQLYDDASSAELGISRYNGTGFQSLTATPLATNVHTGSAVMHLRAGRTTHQLSLDGGWGAETYSAMSAAPNYNGVDRVTLTFGGVIVELRSVTIIATE